MNLRAVSTDDLFELSMVDEPRVDPLDCRVAFTVTRLDREEDGYRSRIWLLDLNDDSLIPLTNGDHRDTCPRWSPEGTSLAFLSDRGSEDRKGPRQIFLMPVSGGEPRQLTNLKHGVESFDWSPDGRTIASVSSCRDPELDAAYEETDVRVITSARFRSDGSGYLEDRYKQILLIDVETGESRQITDGPFDHLQPTWSPNGGEIAFVSNRRDGWEFSNVRDIYLIKTESGQIRQLTTGDGSWSQPSWSPDGRSIAAYGTRELRSGSARNELFLVDPAGTGAQSCTAGIDVDFRDSSISDWNGYALAPPHWTDLEHVLCVAGVRGAVTPVSVNIASRTVTYRAEKRGRYGQPQQLPGGDIVATRTDFCDPGELVLINGGQQYEKVTSFNADWLNQVELTRPEALTATSPDGVEVSGWLMRPPALAEDATAPLLLELHGGPFGMYADTFMHEFHLLAAQGYGIVFTNPRGSSGYGDEFAAMLLPEMGENDFPDVMALLDKAIEEAWVDEDRLGVLGGSYGGFLTNWVVSHSDRFKAAVTQRTVTDWYSAWGTDDIFFADENVTLGATPWEDPDLYYRISPISHVRQIQTPMLIIHSEQDYRCPISQGEQLYIALKRLGRTAEFVRVPDESHGLSRTGKPAHRVERLRHIVRWFETYL